jgi:glycosyltransferase involved in cell wall biosynthesis
VASTGAGPRRVLVYSDSMDFSGAEAVLRDVTAGLARRAGFEVVCAAPRDNAGLSAALGDAAGRSPLDVPAQPAAVGAVHLFDPRRRRRVGRVLAGSGADVLLVNLPSAEYGATPIGVRPPGMPAVGLLHVPGSPRRLGFRLGAFRETLARRALRSLDAVCVLTESAGATYERTWSAGETSVTQVRLPRVEVARMDRGAARSELGLPDGPLVGIAGRVSMRQKGHDTLVEAAAQLADRRPALAFAVAGRGRDEARLAGAVRAHGLEERFHLLGQVAPITPFLSALDAIAIPSRFEGLPLVALETLAAGLPGIASSVDGLGDVWPPPWQVPPDDPVALADALDGLLGAPAAEVARLLAQGRSAASRFTSQDVSSDVGDVLEEVMRGR